MKTVDSPFLLFGVNLLGTRFQESSILSRTFASGVGLLYAAGADSLVSCFNTGIINPVSFNSPSSSYNYVTGMALSSVSVDQSEFNNIILDTPENNSYEDENGSELASIPDPEALFTINGNPVSYCQYYHPTYDSQSIQNMLLNYELSPDLEVEEGEIFEVDGIQRMMMAVQVSNDAAQI